MAGDGGTGKTTIWCAIAAAVSSGKECFMVQNMIPPEWHDGQGRKVMFFSSEDSYEYTLKRRLRKNGANLDNIVTLPISDKRFRYIKFNNDYLKKLLEDHKPDLCIFDPIQGFVPENIKMGDRNAMRSVMTPLIGFGEELGTTFLIAMHTNKQSGVWGRKRMADSSDVWDVSRSVLMVGETESKGIHYLSHEKSNLAIQGKTILYRINDEVIEFVGYTDKKDRDFIKESDFNAKKSPARDEAKEFILEFLEDGEKPVAELDETAKAMSISANALKNAKFELKADGKIKTWGLGYGANKKWLISLKDTSKTNE